MRALVVTALAVTALAVTVLAVSPAHAASGCGGVVQDLADALTPAEEDEVEAAARRLADTGVRPLVIVTRTLGGADTEAYLEARVTACPGLVDSAGEWGGNVLGIVVALEDRLTGVHPGGALPALDPARTEVDTQVINPRLAAGDVAGGLADGLDALAAVHRSSLAAAGPPAADDDAGSGVGLLVAVGGGVALLTGGAATALAWTGRRRRVAQAHAEAAAAQASLAETMVQLEADRGRVQQDVRLMADRLGLAEATPLREQAAVALGAVDAAVTRWYGLTGRIGAAPAGDEATYTQLATEVEGLRPTVQEAVAALAALRVDTEELAALEEELPARLETAAGAHEAIRAGIGDAQARGYRTEPAEDDLRIARDALARAREAREARLLAAADTHLDLAESAAADASAWVQGIEEMRTALSLRTQALRDRHRALVDRVGPALEVMEALERDHPPTALDVVAGNGSEAEAELTAAAAALDDAAHAQLLDVQAWDDAHEALDAAATDLDDAAALLDGIHDHAEALAEGWALLPSTLAGAGQAVEEASRYVTDHAPDVTDALEREVAQLAGELRQAEDAAGQPRPDVLAVQATATRVQRRATELLATAREEVTTADLARRQGEQALRAANVGLRALDGLVRTRGRYLDPQDRRRIASLTDELRTAELMADPVARASRLVVVERDIGVALTDLRRSVQRARDRTRGTYSSGATSGASAGGWLGGAGSVGGSGRGSGGGSRSRGSGSRSRSSSSSSRRRSSSGRSRSGRSTRW